MTNTIKVGDEELDLSKPFFKTTREGDDITVHANLPNDSVGDTQFEWDFDGKQRMAWIERMKELERLGTKGDLVYFTIHMKHNPIFDNASGIPEKAFPLSSYRMYFIP